MKCKWVFVGVLAVNTSLVCAKITHQPISAEAINYIEKSLDVAELRNACDSYKFTAYPSKVTTIIDGVQDIETVDWIVAEQIGNAPDLRHHGLQTINGEVASSMEFFRISEDWQYYLDECKAGNY